MSLGRGRVRPPPIVDSMEETDVRRWSGEATAELPSRVLLMFNLQENAL